MGKKFENDLNFGEGAEFHLAKEFEKQGYKLTKNPLLDSDYDYMVNNLMLEIKNESRYGKKSTNICIEVFKQVMGIYFKSGLSKTKSPIQMHYFDDEHIAVFHVPSMLTHLKTHGVNGTQCPMLHRIEGIGDGNSVTAYLTLRTHLVDKDWYAMTTLQNLVSITEMILEGENYEG